MSSRLLRNILFSILKNKFLSGFSFIFLLIRSWLIFPNLLTYNWISQIPITAHIVRIFLFKYKFDPCNFLILIFMVFLGLENFNLVLIVQFGLDLE